MSLTTKATIASFGGKLLKLTHPSPLLGCEMALNLYLPPQAASSPDKKIPVLFYLAGLTCTGDNGAEKGFFQSAAAEKGIAVVFPDTSPRGIQIEGSEDSWDFGTGAGFYINATTPLYATNYKMESYITKELPSLLFSTFPSLSPTNISISGHSMGGHGALTLFLKNPGLYKSVSAFAPISNPINCPWGQKAFAGYFGEENKESWKGHDATELLKGWKGEGKFEALIDVGTGDGFYKAGQLLPENLEKVAKEKGFEGVKVRYQEDYDHSYFFIATFAKDHIEYAAKHLSV